MRMLINRLNMAVIEDDTHHTKWVEENRKLAHDNFLLPKIRPYLKRFALDIGAHIGTHTVFYAEHSERVVSFEPHPVVFECLRYNTQHLNNVTINNVAISNCEKELSLMEHEGNAGATQTRSSDVTNIKCNAIAIDDLSLNECDFIKIDAEGDELYILDGAIKTLNHFRPVMLIECNEYALTKESLTTNDLKQKIHDLGYTYIMIDSNQNPKHCDLLCLPAPATTYPT
jgi:FkbM family methyltransferase